MKTEKKSIFLLLMLLLPLIANADAIEINGIYYNLLTKNKTAEVARNPNKYSGSIVIPESVNYNGVEYNVTSIGESAFTVCYELSSISIPNKIIEIKKSAFSRCTGLSSITLPDSLTTIGDFAFDGCVFTTITIPKNVTSIGEWAFEDCNNLSSITLPDSIKEIKSRTFLRCRNLASVSIPNGVTRIDGAAFAGCTSLSNISLPDNITIIYGELFLGCTSLTSINIPNNVTTIWTNAFSGCSNLTSVTLGKRIKLISNTAFANCPELSDVYCHAKVVPNTDGDAFEGSYIEYATLHVPNSSINAYKETTPWKDFKEIVKIDMPKHHITYIIDGNEYKSYEVEEDEYITPEPDPTKEGFSFSGWSEIPEVMPDHDVTVTGSFIVNKYKLTYQINGEEYKTYEIEYGATITPEPEPTKEGYTFSGWSWIPSKMPAEDVVVTGSFTANKYKLTYMVDGSEYRVYNIECGSVITPEPAPFKDGYEFSGWSDLPEIMPAHDVTVTGTFTYLPPCEAPIISYENGNLIFECATEGVEFVSDITDSDIKTHYKAIIPLSATYTIKVYAQKEGYKKSEAVTATLCWIDSTPSMEGIENTKMTEIHSIPVLIHAQDGRISIDGIDNGITVSAYTISGFKAGMEKGKDGKAEIITTMQKGETAIVKIGEKAVKVMMQ